MKTGFKGFSIRVSTLHPRRRQSQQISAAEDCSHSKISKITKNILLVKSLTLVFLWIHKSKL